MRLFIFLFGFLLSITTAQADSLTSTADRLTFLQAKFALTHGNYFNFKLLSSQLRQYSLYPYLQYAALTQQLNLSAEPQVITFLQTYADTPLAERLRSQWLTMLADKQRWQTYLKYYQSSTNLSLQCNYAQALWQTQQKAIALKILPAIWLSANTLPDACMPILKMWQANDALTTELDWQRVRLAIKKNLPIDKNFLAFLPISLRAKAEFWQKIKANPQLVTNPNLFITSDEYIKEILIDGIERLAVHKPQQVAALWPTLQNEYEFTTEEQQILIRAIAIELARSADPAASEWLAKIKPIYANELVREWRVRVALVQQNWPGVIQAVSQLSINERQQPVWKYWYARALAKTDHQIQAQTIYKQLVSQVNYYGLLAAQQLNLHYQPTIINNAKIEYTKITAIPAMQRAYELYNLHMISDARREWQWAIKDMNPIQLSTAAAIAMQWNWFDRALMTAAKAGDYDYTVRFPMAYRDQVILSAQQLTLDPAWVFAIMRQESAFMTDAKSGVGALGLMQLMPSTAKLLSVNISNYSILDATTNIALGSRYLKQLYGWYNNNQTIATAAYNIGPTRLAKWIPLYKKLPADIWIDVLPWQETRNYVQTVTLATAIYQQRLQEV